MARTALDELTDVQLDDSTGIDHDHTVWRSELESLEEALASGDDYAVGVVRREINDRLGSADWQVHLMHSGVLAHLRTYPADPDGLPDPGRQVDILDAASRGDLYRCSDTQIMADHGDDVVENVTVDAEAMVRCGLLVRSEEHPGGLRPTTAGAARLAELNTPPARTSWWARLARWMVRRG
jgi:hypothetical protein